MTQGVQDSHDAEIAPRIEAFIQRWQHATGSERSNYQLFVMELCDLLELPKPEPARKDARENAYIFERHLQSPDGLRDSPNRYIDCYRRGAFVLEAKSVMLNLDKKNPRTLMHGARAQAEAYARGLPEWEPQPPFLIVVNVGRVIDLYAQFNGGGRTWQQFPDPASYRIHLEDLCRDEVRQRLRAVWRDPQALDPERVSARVTREVSIKLGELAKQLEAAGHHSQRVAGFLTRCLFTMFAEDVDLLPAHAFTELLKSAALNPASFKPKLEELWRAMDRGAYSVAIDRDVLLFNGKLFKDPEALPLERSQIEQLMGAARADWKHVEPAIFGTLLERALVPDERHALGAHYTPRAYVERLVWPTVIEPLRQQWADIQAAALLLDSEGRHKEAIEQVRAFQHQLCQTRVLDPACGSGNFLYVTMEAMKRLEGEVLGQLEALGASQSLETEGLTVDPHQFLGLELNPRAAALAELVLWIGYLQWHFRTRRNAQPPHPVLRDFHNIECRDAVLAYDRVELETDADGRPVTRWDGKTTKTHPVTGEQVPDETAHLGRERYLNPRRADWPAADYIVGNPPYLGARTIRLALGDGYLEALRAVYVDVPDNADYVMYWWDKAADLVNAGKIDRFGFITTNSIRQEFSRKVLLKHFAANTNFSLSYCVPDHPWVDAATGAAVRVAMTTADATGMPGRLATVIKEEPGGDGEVQVTLEFRIGRVSPSLTIGTDSSSAVVLKANAGISCVGYQLTGQGFVVNAQQAESLDPYFGIPGKSRIRPLFSGRDIVQTRRGDFAIDLFGLDLAKMQQEYPAIYQWVLTRVKPERDHNPRNSLRQRWWIFGEARSTFRPALSSLTRAIATSLTAKHRTFVFVDPDAICDSTTVMFALNDAFHFGVLTSHIHVIWALAAGGTLEDRPRYNKTRCFETFPFPDATPEQQACIRDLAERLDAHRKRQQAAHPELTLTGLYNVLEKLRAGEPLTTKEKTLHELGLVSVLKQLHDELDAAVLAAYGWTDLALPRDRETLLQRLVDLNARRAAEEAQGTVRWLRPAFQHPSATTAGLPVEMAARPVVAGADAGETGGIPPEARPWPATLPEQMGAVAEVLARTPWPITLEELAARFKAKGKGKARLPMIVETLETLGRAHRLADGRLTGVL